MIKEFKNTPYKQDTGVINKGMLEQIKLLHSQDPVAAGELAISLMEEILTGDHSSDHFMVSFSLANFKGVIENARVRREATIEARKSREEEDLRPIADMLNSGMKQADIAKKLNVAQSTISKKLAKIRKEFPFLLNIPICGNIPEYSNTGNNIPNEEYIPNIPDIPISQNIPESGINGINSDNQENIPNIPVFQIFQDVYGNGNVNGNVYGNVSGNPSGVPSSGGEPPHPPTASPVVESKYRRKFDF